MTLCHDEVPEGRGQTLRMRAAYSLKLMQPLFGQEVHHVSIAAKQIQNQTPEWPNTDCHLTNPKEMSWVATATLELGLGMTLVVRSGA